MALKKPGNYLLTYSIGVFQFISETKSDASDLSKFTAKKNLQMFLSLELQWGTSLNFGKKSWATPFSKYATEMRVGSVLKLLTF